MSLRKRSPEQWAEAVMAVAEEVRPEVGRIVWWDYFSNRTVPERWAHLDEYLAGPWRTSDLGKVLKGLLVVGYTKSQAKYRLSSAWRYEHDGH